jgi:hypothetical protein
MIAVSAESLNVLLTIQGPILNRFSEMRCRHIVITSQIGNCTRHFAYPVVGACTESKLLHCLFKEALCRGVEVTVTAQFTDAHGGIMWDRRSGKTPVLPGTSGIDAGSDGRRRLCHCW